MAYFLLLSFLLGSLVVFQPALNRVLLESRGLGFAIFLNGAIVFLLALLFLAFLWFSADRVPEFVRPKWRGVDHLWFVLPGLMGFTLVVSVPLCFRHFGAVSTVLVMLLGQLVTSFLWDFLWEEKPLQLARGVAVLLAFIAAYLSVRSS